jgi:DNA-binding NarL/FixJ family response regulator
MPDGTSAGLLNALRASGAKVITYTGCTRPDIPYRALSLGAAGFCGKADAPAKLIETIS